MDSERTDSSPQAPEQHGPEQPRRTRERAFAPLSRRSFLGVAAACGLAAGAGLAGCAPKPDDDPTAQENEQEQPDKNMAPTDIKETLDADVLVVGLGMSGLAAAVQAASNGAKVIGIEKMNATGGNGIGVEGIFAVGSSLEVEQGIEIDPAEIVRGELEASQWASGGDLWLDLVHSSGGNVDWLMEQGVKFSGVVDDYHGNSAYPDFHWFDGDVASSGYIPQMTDKAKELGVDMLLETPAVGLIQDGQGAVTGAYAESKERGTLQINAKSVILATGSWGQSKDYISQRGFMYDNVRYGGVDGHEGDGITMASAAGARNFVSNSTFNCTNTIGEFEFKSTFIWNAGGGGTCLFVNENGDRFINEDFAQNNFELQSVPAMTQKQMYTVFDRAILETWLKDAPDELDTVDNANDEALAKADTIEEAAKAIGLDADALKATVDQYNRLASAGVDTDFGKAPEFLVPITQPPFYVGKLTQELLVGIGGIETNRHGQALDHDKNPIAGLYAIGTDGCMLYRNIYTINVGGTCNANNINSARNAANHATGSTDGKAAGGSASAGEGEGKAGTDGSADDGSADGSKDGAANGSAGGSADGGSTGDGSADGSKDGSAGGSADGSKTQG